MRKKMTLVKDKKLYISVNTSEKKMTLVKC